MKRKLIVFIISLVCVAAKAQKLPEITPPSPTAAGLMKYGEIPIGHYTGTPNISIPIYDMSIDGISLPITLSYHASGIRVKDVGSQVGLGWSLNAGGNIGVNTVGANDEVKLYNWDPIITQKYVDTLSLGHYDNLILYSNQTLNTIVESIGNNTFNTEPDIYIYNFSGISGKFIKANDGEFYSYPVDKVKIIREPQGTGEIGYKWKLVSTNGTKFYFGNSNDDMGEGNEIFELNDGLIYSGGGTIPQAAANLPTSWFLRKVVSNKGKTIDLDYNTRFEEYNVAKSSSYRWHSGGNLALSNPSTYDKYSYEGKSKIYEISSSNAIVKFYHSIARNDMQNGYLLSKIEVIDKKSLSVIKTFDLTYENTTNRVYLKTVKEDDKPAYQFSYYSGLPNRFSKDQDFWGFYNASYNNVVGHMVGKPINFSGTIPVGISFADREPNKNVMNAGSLKEIIYPTGGKTKFIYEAHKYSKSLYSFTEETIDNVQNKTVQCNQKNTPVTYNFSLVKNEDVTFNLNFSNYLIPPNNDEDINLNPIIKIKNLSTNVETVWKATDKPSQNFTNDNISLGTKKISFSETLSLSSGNYQITANILCPPFGCMGNVIPVSKVSFSYVSSFSYPAERGAYTGGIRIKSIKNYSTTSEASLVSEKNYDYSLSNGFSSGHLTHKMYSAYTTGEGNYIGSSSGCGRAYYDVFTIGSSDVSSRGVNTGHIGYEQVTEYYNTGEIGKTVYNFNYVPRAATNNNSLSYPYTQDTTGDFFMNGLLNKKEDFKKNTSGSFVLINKKENVYTISGSNKRVFEGVKLAKSMVYDHSRDQLCGNHLSQSDKVITNHYTFETKWYYLSNTINTTYDLDGLNPIIVNTDYFYDNPDHIQLTRTSTQTSDGKTTETKTYYPDDVVNSSSLGYSSLSTSELNAVKELQATSLHQIATPVQVKTTVKDASNNVLSQNIQRTNFSEPFTDLVLPSSVEVLKGTYNSNSSSSSYNILEPRIVYHQYDAKGNPLEVSKKDGTHIVYVWGYNETQPIAKIENSTYSTVLSALGATEMNLLKGNTLSESAIRTKMEVLRNHSSMTNAQVSTYTYKPLIGVTSITDPRGQVVYYHYDTFNRLEYVTDEDGKVLNKNEYYYKN